MEWLENIFIYKAFLMGLSVGVVCSQLGLFLIPRRMSLIGDSLSHISLGAIAVGIVIGIYPLLIAFPIAIFSTLLILKLGDNSRIHFDTALGIVSTIGIATAIILTSVSSQFNIELINYLFGNILLVGDLEVLLNLAISLITLFFLSFYYWDFFSITFDTSFAHSRGIKVKKNNRGFMILIALNVIIAIKVVGALLVSALLILPAASALQLAKSFQQAKILSAIFATSSVIGGIFFSFFFNFPTGATIVIFNAIILNIIFFLKKNYSNS